MGFFLRVVFIMKDLTAYYVRIDHSPLGSGRFSSSPARTKRSALPAMGAGKIAKLHPLFTVAFLVD
jgi:hypothetical protein